MTDQNVRNYVSQFISDRLFEMKKLAEKDKDVRKSNAYL